MVIHPYTPADDEAALALEAACVQGGSLALRFRRPSFHARSGVYRHSAILCAWQEGRLIGIVAGARKQVDLHGEAIEAAYFYDLRVDPEHRGRGISRKLVDAILDEVGRDADLQYLLAARQNSRMLGLINGHYAAEVIIQLAYVCVPVFRRTAAPTLDLISAAEARARYIEHVSPVLVPVPDDQRLSGHVASVHVEGASATIWTNENLLAEEVVRLPLPLRALRSMSTPLRRLVPLPHVPADGERIASWFLCNVSAWTEGAFRLLLDAVNDLALSHGRTVIYLLLQPADPTLTMVRRARPLSFTLPYAFLARGRVVPRLDDRLYVDMRDL